MNEVARDVMDPRTGKPVFEEARRRQVLNTPEAERAPREQDAALWLAPLGSGSDYTPFLQHLTLASLNVGFGGESNGGIYHSMYDTVNWYTKFSDGDFAYGRTLSQLTGTLLLRLADAAGAAVPVHGHGRHADALRDGARRRWRRRARTPGSTSVRCGTASRRSAAPPLDYERAYARVDGASSAAIDARAELRSLNKLLLQSERKLGNGDGLPRRDWFKHQIYAPGFYTGYGVKTMPQIREGLEEQRPDEARDGVRKVAAAVNGLAEAGARGRDAPEKGDALISVKL